MHSEVAAGARRCRQMATLRVELKFGLIVTKCERSVSNAAASKEADGAESERERYVESDAGRVENDRSVLWFSTALLQATT
jgi:hypothetical protein